MLKQCFLVSAVVALGITTVRAESDAGLPAEDQPVFWDQPLNLPAAGMLLAAVRAALPHEPLRVTAHIQSKDQAGRLEKTLQAEMLLDWQSGASSAEYLIRDAFGAPLDKLTVQHFADAPSAYTYAQGEKLTPARVPSLDQAVQGTDISWADLTLSFLWWKDGRTTGMEKVKGRSCFVLDLPAPPGAVSGLAGVRLWVDPRLNVLLRAAAYDAEGGEVRRMDVKSLKKIDDLWVLKDLEVRSLPSRHKALLRVDHVERLAAPQPPAGMDDPLEPAPR
jgi:hypothetical protein